MSCGGVKVAMKPKAAAPAAPQRLVVTRSLARVHPPTKFDTAAEMTFFLQVYNLPNIYVVSK